MDHLPSDAASGSAGKPDPGERDQSDNAPNPDPEEQRGLPKTTPDSEEPDSKNSSDAQWLCGDDFAGEIPDQPIATSLSHQFEQRLPGPGLPEAILWAGGVLIVHLIGGAVVAAVLLITHAVRNGADNPQQLIDSMQTVLKTNLVPLMGGEMLIFVFCAVLAGGLRLRPHVSDRLGLRPLPVRHLLGLTLLVLPLSFVCGQFYSWAMIGWKKIVEIVPPLQRFDSLNSTESIVLVAEQASFPMMLFLVALLPAVGEELVFRGIIGRGLIARWGLVWGVALTSLLFAAVHIHPVHALGLLPLAVCIHLVYLATRSFWAPVALHLLNNAWATVVMKSSGLENSPGTGAAESVPLLLFAVSAGCALMVSIVIWRSRVRYVLPDGTFWNPGYETVEVPPYHLHAVAECRRVETGLIVAAVLSVAAFAGVLSLMIVSGG